MKVTPLLWKHQEQNLEILLDGKTDYGLRKLFAASDKLQDIKLETVVKWDSLIREIGAASIVAKVQRDEYMTKIWSRKRYQSYEFDRHKWYGTLVHRTAIAEYGLSDQHRKSFCKNINTSNN
jgi:ribonuclease HII